MISQDSGERYLSKLDEMLPGSLSIEIKSKMLPEENNRDFIHLAIYTDQFAQNSPKIISYDADNTFIESNFIVFSKEWKKKQIVQEAVVLLEPMNNAINDFEPPNLQYIEDT